MTSMMDTAGSDKMEHTEDPAPTPVEVTEVTPSEVKEEDTKPTDTETNETQGPSSPSGLPAEEEPSLEITATDTEEAIEEEPEETRSLLVTEDRKNVLLLEARANRLEWIQKVPLPYSTTESDSSGLESTYVLQQLPTAKTILTHLYGADQHLLAQKVKDLEQPNDFAVRQAEEIMEEAMDTSAPDVKTVLQNYQSFLTKLARPESAVMVNGIRSFLSKMQDPSSLKAYVESTGDQLRTLWQTDTEVRRSLESFLYGHAYDKVWSALGHDLYRDDECYVKLQSMSFVKAAHLDLSCFVGKEEDSLKASVAVLLSTQKFFSPFEKLQRILGTYREVNEALKAANGGKLPSADDVLPTLILTVLQAKPKNIVSTLSFLEMYSPPEYLRGEAGYAYTNLYGAVQFLLDLDLDEENPKNLSISPEEFRSGLTESRAAIETKVASALKEKIPTATFVEPPGTFEIPVVRVREARVAGEVVDLEWGRKFAKPENAGESTQEEQDEEDILPVGFTRQYSYLSSRPDDIRLSDLGPLLQEYRMLVRTTETLLAERAKRSSVERKKRLKAAQKTIEENALSIGMELGSNTRKF